MSWSQSFHRLIANCCTSSRWWIDEWKHVVFSRYRRNDGILKDELRCSCKIRDGCKACFGGIVGNQKSRTTHQHEPATCAIGHCISFQRKQILSPLNSMTFCSLTGAAYTRKQCLRAAPVDEKAVQSKESVSIEVKFHSRLQDSSSFIVQFNSLSHVVS
jgi:hypothetical protein